ncbi:MAG: hypothetical protein ACK56W_24505 [Pirellula sp.]|jgi:hypothetical protein|nr:hypothetical protein [Pirellula sp.]
MPCNLPALVASGPAIDGDDSSLYFEDYFDGTFEAIDLDDLSYHFGYVESGFGLSIGSVYSEEGETFFFADEATGDFYWSSSASGGLMMPSNVGIGGIIKKIIEILIKKKPKPPVKPKPPTPPKKDPPKDLDDWEDQVRRQRQRDGKDYPPDDLPPRKPNIPDHGGPPVPDDPS